MIPSDGGDGYHVLVLKADRLCAGILRDTALQAFPSATIRMTGSRLEAAEMLRAKPVNLLLTGLAFLDGDALELLGVSDATRRGFLHALVVSGRREYRLLAILRELPINGVFDPMNDDLARLSVAIRQTGAGGRYWSESVLARLKHKTNARSLCHLLSPTEELILATIGDGSDDTAAAARLSLRPSTIHSVRRELHRKLGVQHKGELMRIAAQHGYVRFTADGVERPGFSNLLAACGRGELPANTVSSKLS